MRTRIAELRWKEVVDVQNGSRFGYVEDLEVDLESGQVRALVLPGRRRLFGLLGREGGPLYPLGPGPPVRGGHHSGGAGAPSGPPQGGHDSAPPIQQNRRGTSRWPDKALLKRTCPNSPSQR